MAMPGTAHYGFDAAIVDSENEPVALVEVKMHPVEKWATILPRRLAKFPGRVTYFLAVDPSCIQLYRAVADSLGEPIVRLDTRQVLRHYDPEFPRQRMFESYLLTLVEAWVRDLAYHWKSENPPGSDELGRAGLLEKLAGGTTRLLEA
jgi:hypothetical protein